MSAFARVIVAMAALASLSGLVASTAGAVTWHNAGSTTYTATAGPGTFSSTGANVTCTGSRATGTATVRTIGAIYAVSGTAVATGCAIAGVQMYGHCNYTLTAITQPSAGVTTGSTVETCQLRITSNNVAICSLHGATPGTYTNPSGATPGRITALTALSLRITNADAGSCPLGNNDLAQLTHKTGTITGGTPTTLGPIITRTA